MFRNDPLESLKVSSTFDAIPFVREYLQKEIEGQLRTLLMDEVPVIIHRLSQRLWVPEYQEREDGELARSSQDPTTKEKPVDPLASPPQDPVDVSGNALDASQIASLTLDSGSEMHALFSQKNLLRLGALTDSQRTLSLFTPGIRDVVFRAWAGPTERGEMYGNSGRATPVTPAMMTRAHSFTGSISNTYTFAEALTAELHASRPGLSSYASATSGLGQSSSRHGKSYGGRKRKHRVVNLRKKATNGDDLESMSGESSTASGTMSSTPSEFGGRPSTPENREKDELITPPSTPEKFQQHKEPGDGTPIRFRNVTPQPPSRDIDATPRASMYDVSTASRQPRTTSTMEVRNSHPYSQVLQSSQASAEKVSGLESRSSSKTPLKLVPPSPYLEPPLEVLPEQTWMTKMVSEIARKVQDQKAADSGFWDHREQEAPPPAYGA